MSDGKAFDLKPLEEHYEILGELRSGRGAPTYLARRRADGADVSIAVFQAPQGGEHNELSHFAADIKLQSGAAHPAVPAVLDGRWLGTAAFATVTERVVGSSLAELIARGERLRNPRIAAVLHEVEGVLDWARNLGIVHRNVTPDTLFFDPEFNRFSVALAPAAIPVTGAADPASDARTIGALAWTMLAGQPFVAGSNASLAELRPDLATRVTEATEKMVRCKLGDDAPDIATFIAIVASGDVLKQAEVEMEALKDEYTEEHRRELLRCENKRIEVEEHAAEQAARLAEDRAAMEQDAIENATLLAEERAKFEQEIADKQASLDRLMDARQAQLAEARAELEKHAAEIEERLASLQTVRAEFEQFRMEEERRIDEQLRVREAAFAAAQAAAEATAIAAERDVVSDSSEGTPLSDSPAHDTERPIQRSRALADREVPSLPRPSWEPGRKLDDRPLKSPRAALDPLDRVPSIMAPPRRRQPWVVPAGIAASVILLVCAALGISHYQQAGQVGNVRFGNSVLTPGAPAVNVGRAPRGGFLTQEAAGSVAPRFGMPLATRPSGVSLDSAAATSATSATSTARPVGVAPLGLDSAATAIRARATAANVDSTSTPRPRATPARRRTEPTNESRDAFSAVIDNALGRDTMPVVRDTGRQQLDSAPRHSGTIDTAGLNASFIRRDTVTRPDSGR